MAYRMAHVHRKVANWRKKKVRGRIRRITTFWLQRSTPFGNQVIFGWEFLRLRPHPFLKKRPQKCLLDLFDETESTLCIRWLHGLVRTGVSSDDVQTGSVLLVDARTTGGELVSC